MKISHTWTNEDGIEMAWASPSSREIAEYRKDGGEERVQDEAPEVDRSQFLVWNNEENCEA